MLQTEKQQQDVITIQKTNEPRLKPTNILRFLEISHHLIEVFKSIRSKLNTREFFRLFSLLIWIQYIKPKEYAIYLDQEDANFSFTKKKDFMTKHISKQDLLDTLVEHVMHTGDEL